MITIKLPYQSTPKFQEVLKELRREYSSVVRYSFNRYHEAMKQKDIRNSLKSLNNINHLNSWLKQCGVMEGSQLFARFKKQPDIIFGGKFNFKQRILNKITKEEYQNKRLLPLSIQGEALQSGNRMFRFHLLNDNQIEFKLNIKEHFFLKLPKINRNYQQKLEKLQLLNEENGYTYSVKLTATHIFISFEEFKTEEKSNYHDNRYIGIDMNPDTVGISVLESGKVIHAVEYSLKPIFDKILSLNLSSKDDKMKYFQHKLQFETIQIAKSISKLAKHYQCKTVYVEDLKFKQKLSVEQKRKHTGNRKNRNLWKRDLFKCNLEKRLNIFGIKMFSVNPAYSSFIGNLQNDYSDAVNASIEIARRGYEYRILRNKNSFYPLFDVKHQWKKMATSFKDWKKLFLEIKKKPELKYRVSLEDALHPFSVFRLNQCHESKILLYDFS